MVDDAEWEALRETEQKHFHLRHEIWSSPDAATQFRAALKSAKYRRTALRTLEDAPKPLIASLFSELFDETLGSPEYVGLARAALMRLEKYALSQQLYPHVHNLLDRDDITDWEYRRVCELLDEAHASDLLRAVVDRASTSKDPNIVEVAEDYRNSAK
ncbi:hypothetical protein HLB23_36445 [Nocardia uniformis]|uniref:Uncharacterized protein n=1 Tax=Nocardia uniformis TaxID=53432 RepID=A0A849C9N6_9NOCA|nr:hypothetical protein [Nocardia uniformis]NNH75282.1 hypothetical protein [Nocardia uniformis]